MKDGEHHGAHGLQMKDCTDLKQAQSFIRRPWPPCAGEGADAGEGEGADAGEGEGAGAGGGEGEGEGAVGPDLID